MTVGVFDSGVGGLTVLKKLIEKYPLNDYIYFGDTINIPYGEKSVDTLYKLSVIITRTTRTGIIFSTERWNLYNFEERMHFGEIRFGKMKR